MELEKETPVPDDERRLAEAKKLTLQPVHTDVTPEPPSDAQAVARHLAGPAIANASSDIEQDVSPIQPSQGVLRTPHPVKKWKNERKFVVSLVIITVLFTLAATAVAIGFSLLFLS